MHCENSTDETGFWPSLNHSLTYWLCHPISTLNYIMVIFFKRFGSSLFSNHPVIHKNYENVNVNESNHICAKLRNKFMINITVNVNLLCLLCRPGLPSIPRLMISSYTPRKRFASGLRKVPWKLSAYINFICLQKNLQQNIRILKMMSVNNHSRYVSKVTTCFVL